MENSHTKQQLFLIFQKITFILTIVIFCLSFACYNIIPSIDSEEFKKKLTQKKLYIKLLSKLEFLKVENKTLNNASYLPFGKYVPKYLGKHDITNINSNIYKANDYVMKVTYSIFRFENYDKQSNSCKKGYKSCGEISYINYKLYCVEENDECPINEFFFSNSPELIDSGKEYNTIKSPFNFYIHYLPYNSNDHFNRVLEDFGFSTLKSSTNNISRDFYIERFQSNTDNSSTYPNGTSTESNYYYNNYSFSYSEIASSNDLEEHYNDTNRYYIGCLLSPYKNVFDLQLNINSSSSNEEKRIFYFCNDINNSSFRDKIKKNFKIALIINLVFTIISLIFLTIEMIIFQIINKIIPKLTLFFLISRILETIFILILFIFDCIIVSSYNSNLQEKLCINYKRGYHVIIILSCILLFFSHIFIIYLFQNLKTLTDLIINNGINIEPKISEPDKEKEDLENWEKELINRKKKIEEKENNILFIEESNKKIIQSKKEEIDELNNQFIELNKELKKKRNKDHIFDEII